MSETIQARVFQKIDTLENWNANPLILGTGEQAFVQAATDLSPIIFKVGNGINTFAELSFPDFSVKGKCSAATAFTGSTPHGIYIPTESGSYNSGTITVALSDGYQVLYWDGTTVTKVVYPISLSGYATLANLNSYATLAYLNGMITPGTADGIFAVSDPNGIDGMRLDADGTFETYKSKMQALSLGTTNVTEDGNKIFIMGAADSNGNIAFAVDSNGVWTVSKIVAKDLVVQNSVSLPNNISQRLPMIYGYITDYIGVIQYGQSNADGNGGSDIITTVQKYDSLMLSKGLREEVNDVDTGLVPLVESVTSSGQQGETSVSAMLEMIIQRIQSENFLPYQNKGFQFIGGVPAQPGRTLAQLSKGTAYYDRFIYQVTRQKHYADIAKKSYAVGYCTWIQGEANTFTGADDPNYKANLVLLLKNLNDDVAAVTGQKSNFPMFMTQVSYNSTDDPSKVAQQQIEVCMENDNMIMVCPTYHFNYEFTDKVHFKATYDRICGAYQGLAIKRHLFSPFKKFNGVIPKSFVVTGNNLIINYEVPVGPLVLDTSDVSNPGDFGFQVNASGGAALTLSNIKILPTGNQVSIDCSASPSGGTFNYANKTGASIDFPSATPPYTRMYARGNLRDSQGDYIKWDSNYPLHNYAPRITKTIS